MTGTREVIRDERTVAVENASYRLAFGFLSFALLVDVMIRSYFRSEAPWDLLALVIAGGTISTLYQWIQRVLTPHSARVGVIAAFVASAIAVAVTMARTLR